jgi:hypothetical protein
VDQARFQDAQAAEPGEVGVEYAAPPVANGHELKELHDLVSNVLDHPIEHIGRLVARRRAPSSRFPPPRRIGYRRMSVKTFRDTAEASVGLDGS